MMDNPPAILHRRDFLKLAALGLGTLTLFPNSKQPSPELLIGEPLGRVNVGKVEVKNLPDVDSKTTLILYEDAIVRWLREVVGRNPNRTSQRWVETPDGYIWSPYLQPVLNQPNVPFKVLPESSVGPGMWTEVSTPFVDMLLANPPARSPGFQNRLQAGLPVRLYFSQLVWVDGLRADEQGQIWYRINERFGTYGDILWGKAEAFRPVSSEEIEAINPEATEKRVVVNIAYQTLSCYQEDDEVFFARISSGALYDYRGNKVDAWATPTGKIPI